MRSLHKNKRGIIYVWIMLLFGFPFFALLYFILMGPASMMINIDALWPGLPPMALETLNIWLSVITWMGMFFIVSMVIWAISNSQKRDPYQ